MENTPLEFYSTAAEMLVILLLLLGIQRDVLREHPRRFYRVGGFLIGLGTVVAVVRCLEILGGGVEFPFDRPFIFGVLLVQLGAVLAMATTRRR